MTFTLRTCLLILLAAGNACLAAEFGELDEPIFVPPSDPLESYDASLSRLESLVDTYFLAALRANTQVSDADFVRLNQAMLEQAESRVGESPGRLLTAREFTVRAKIVLLRELDARFAGSTLPADVTEHLNALAVSRQPVFELLVEGGAL